VLRRISGPKGNEMAGDRRRLHNEELHNLYASPNIVWVIKSRRMRWVDHVACIGGMRNSYKILVRKSKGKKPSEDLGIDGKIILECILEK
jgi:hypothetical protein